MLKKTITYTDYNGVERTEDYHFDLTEAEIAEMEWGVTGGLSAQLTRAVNAKDLPELVKIFKMMILVSFGIRNPDGIHFDKSEEISKAFSHTLAYEYVNLKYACNVRHNKEPDSIELEVFIKQREEMGTIPRLSLVATRADQYITLANFFFVVREKTAAYSIVDLYVQLDKSNSDCVLFELARDISNPDTVTVQYFTDDGFIDELPEDKTTLESMDASGQHDHAKNQIVDMPTNVSEFENDADYVSNIGTPKNFVMGTQTTSTNSWTGVLDLPAIYHGMTIVYWLPYGASGDVTLNLTLSDGTTTDPLLCYNQAYTRLNTQYPMGSAIKMTYLENMTISSTQYTGWWADYHQNDNDYYRLEYRVSFKCGPTAIVPWEIIVGQGGKYQPLRTRLPFDINFPILISTRPISANGTSSTNNFIYYPVQVTYTQSLNLTLYAPVYIKGHLSGTIFTPESKTPITQTIPTSYDGYQYMLLGLAHSITIFHMVPSHPIYEYINGAFRKYGEINFLRLDRLRSLTVNDRFLVGTPDGHKCMDAPDVFFAMLDAFSLLDQRRVICRGKYLGDENSLLNYRQTIRDGEFKDLFLGDYWSINGVYWRIVDFDYWLEIGDDPLLEHHVVIMPDTVLGFATMSDTKDTTGGYYAAWPYSFGEYLAMLAITNAFSTSQGSMLLGHLELLATGKTDGTEKQVWIQSGIDLPNEPMIYGGYRLATPVYDPTAGNVDYRYTSSTKQLALFQLCPRFIPAFDNESYWLRDVTSTETFAAVGPTGETKSLSADESFGIRPVFAIG